jgi:transposase
MNALNLPAYVVLDTQQDEHDLHFFLETISPPSICLCCGSVKGDIVGYGRDMQIFMDTPMYGKRVGLHINRRRMKCRDCNSTFLEPLRDMHDGHRATRRLVEYIEKRVMLKETFARIAADVGLSEWTIRSIFDEFAALEQKRYHPDTPRFLGIDEAHLFRHYRCVITDVEKRTIIDLLENRSTISVANYLRKMHNRNRVEVVCMDMWQPYREAVKAVFPEAKIVVDKYHVVRYASQGMDDIRKDVKKTLTAEKQRRAFKHDRYALLKRPDKLNAHEQLALGHCLTYPLLKQAYELKESFYDIFDNSPDRHFARQEYDAWLERLTPETQRYFEPLTKAMENWSEEIFSYFDLMPNPVTNAYTEALNGIIKLINKNGRGYKFNVLRAKILFSEGVHKVITPKFNRLVSSRSVDNSNGMLVCEPGEDYQIREDGVDMYTLLHLLEDGLLFLDQQ